MTDAVVVGTGPNGLAAAITLAQAGRSVLVLEARDTIGGGTRTEELTLPGFRHDVCSAVHPLVRASPFLRTLPLAEHGLEWIDPPVPLAHPLDGSAAVVLERSVGETAAALGRDGDAYRRLLGPLVTGAPELLGDVLGPLRLPQHPVRLAAFAARGLRPATSLALTAFADEPARALLAGCAAHSMLPLEAAGSAAFGLILTMLGHAVGWPFPRGGSRAIGDALAAHLVSLGGEIRTGHEVRSLADLPRAGIVVLAVTPRQLLELAGNRLAPRYCSRLQRFRYGPGVVKVDYALSGPVPWSAPACTRAATVHVGGTLAEIALAEREVARGRHAERPFVLSAQPSLFDPTRAPAGLHTLWAYCHVPHGSRATTETAARIEAQLERFAPGFRDLVLARSILGPAELEARNPNLVGGDVNGGLQDLRQLLARPVAARNPYATPLPGVYLCSSSTPPGGGVHGMCGHWAARAAIAGSGRRRRRPGRSAGSGEA